MQLIKNIEAFRGVGNWNSCVWCYPMRYRESFFDERHKLGSITSLLCAAHGTTSISLGGKQRNSHFNWQKIPKEVSKFPNFFYLGVWSVGGWTNFGQSPNFNWFSKRSLLPTLPLSLSLWNESGESFIIPFSREHQIQDRFVWNMPIYLDDV